MKKTIFIVALLLGGFLSQTANAQLRVGININIGSQPVWGPVGYDHVDYYYLPDIDAFYYVPNRQYIYMNRGRWIFSTSLPYQYRNFDLYTGYKVVINEPRPYNHYRMYREKYKGYKGNHSQEVIRNSHDPRYYENKGHPEYKNWKRDHDERIRKDRDERMKKYRDQKRNNNRGNRGNNGIRRNN